MNKTHKKNNASRVYIILIVFLVLVFTVSVSAKNNIALNCEIDSSCGESAPEKSAQMLVDADPGYDTKWEASDGSSHPGEPHRVILDFGTEKIFDSIKLIKASQGAADFGRAELNASGFDFEISSDKKNWIKICEAADDGDNDIFECSFIPVSARYLKLSVTNPERDENSDENQAVKLYDLKVFEYISITEETSGDGETEEITDNGPVPLANANITSPDTSDYFDCFDLILLFAACVQIIALRFIFLRFKKFQIGR